MIHGTTGYRRGCRCDICSQAQSSYMREYRTERRKDPAIAAKLNAAERMRQAQKRTDPEWAATQRRRSYTFRTRTRRRLDAIKRQRGCADCGTRKGRLDFDHRPGTTKLFSLAHGWYSWPTVLAEIAKCDVRCVSCHAKRHGFGTKIKRKAA